MLHTFSFLHLLCGVLTLCKRVPAELRAHPRGSCCCSGRFSQDSALSLTLCYPLAFGLGFLSRNSRAGFLWTHVQAAERVPAKSLVLPCSEELYGAAEVREENGRSDLQAGSCIRKFSQHVGDGRSLPARCSFWSCEHKNS